MAIPNIWRTRNERYQLQGTICNSCSTPIFPARHTCPNCSRLTEPTKPASSQPKRHYVMPTPQPTASLANTGDD